MPFFWKKNTEPEPVLWHPDNKETVADTPQIDAKDIRRELAQRDAQADVLTADELRQLHEQRRLSLLRVESLQNELDAANEHTRLHNEYINLCARIDELRAIMYERGKTLAALRDDEQRLSRFEACEDALPLYFRLQTRMGDLTRQRELTSGLKETMRAMRIVADKATMEMDTARTVSMEADRQLASKEEELATGYKTEGSLASLREDKAVMEDALAAVDEELKRYRSLREDLETRMRDITSRLTSNRSLLAPLDANRDIMERTSALMVRLDRLTLIDAQRKTVGEEIERIRLKQIDLNERLGSLISRDQDIETRLATLHAEVERHREANRGIDGQRLQMEVMELRTRRQTLTEAETLWRAACELQNSIDARRHTSLTLRQKIERDAAEVEAMEQRVKQLSADTERRRYDYTLSKGQNVIHLRADLREGVACTVCGALNHPFHSDTLLEQDRLIGIWKGEVEKMDMELRGARSSLLALQLSTTSDQAVLGVISDELTADMHRLSDMEKRWAKFATLDPSLSGFQPNVYADSRMMTIRGLIEASVRDERDAVKRLETYNFHQREINVRQTEADAIENERQDLQTALTETNTSCQVMTAAMDFRKHLMADCDAKYQTEYKLIDSIINSIDWHNRYRASADAFKAELLRRHSEWKRLSTAVAEDERKEAEVKCEMNLCESSLADFEMIRQKLLVRMQRMDDMVKDLESLAGRLFGGRTVHQVYDEARVKALGAREAMLKSVTEAMKTSTEYEYMRGREGAMTEQLDQVTVEVGDARTKLDDWMYQFRMKGNPPCRIDELDELFAPGTNWHLLRGEIYKARLAHELARLEEADANGRLMAMEEGGAKEVSDQQREKLIAQRADLLLSIARINHRLSVHELALKKLEIIENER
ncbi:MAG: hypothetical protein HUK00_02190 [Bacteroidaceae bacterium]|nr:hypothetical protein [Bacteroidaceae bacterium]